MKFKAGDKIIALENYDNEIVKGDILIIEWIDIYDGCTDDPSYLLYFKENKGSLWDNEVKKLKG